MKLSFKRPTPSSVGLNPTSTSWFQDVNEKYKTDGHIMFLNPTNKIKMPNGVSSRRLETCGADKIWTGAVKSAERLLVLMDEDDHDHREEFSAAKLGFVELSIHNNPPICKGLDSLYPFSPYNVVRFDLEERPIYAQQKYLALLRWELKSVFLFGDPDNPSGPMVARSGPYWDSYPVAILMPFRRSDPMLVRKPKKV